MNIANPTTPKKINLPLAVFGSCVGNVVEWYNFMIYGYLAITIAKVFFPNSSAAHGLILTFLLFAIGFLARPIGAFIFGVLGDHIGRQKTLLFSQIFMSIPTLAIAFLPTYQQIGIAAPWLLALCRLLQGISIAGEYTTSLCYLYEMAPAQYKSRYISMIPASTAFGILLSSLITYFVVSIMPEADMNSWGWRLIFFSGFICCVISIIVRLFLPETLIFLANLEKRTHKSLFVFFLTEWNLSLFKNIFITVILCITYAYLYQLLYIWLPVFLTSKLHVAYNTALLLNTLAMIFFMTSIYFGGFLTDKLGEKVVLLFSLLSMALYSYIFFHAMLIHHTLDQEFGLVILISIFFGIFVASSSTFFSEVFPSIIRSTILSISYNIPFAIVGGLTPAFLTTLVTNNEIKTIIILTLCIILFSIIISLLIANSKKNID